MIDPRELRIGNYISYYIYDQQNPYPDRIKSIYFDDESKEYRLEMESGRFSLRHLTIQEIKPIPLTEDILLKCGFRKLPYGEYRLEHFLYRLEHRSIQDLKYHETEVFYDDVSYLHDLQNFFYDLTKTELNVQL